jgi:hypothetical protein
VLGDLLLETSAEGLRPLSGPLLGDTHLPLLDALVRVGPVPEVGQLPASVPTTAPIADSMGSPLRSVRAFAWRKRTSLAISATV